MEAEVESAAFPAERTESMHKAMVVAALLAFACGCGTAANLIETTEGPGPKKVYGGVRSDCENVLGSLQSLPVLGPFWSSVCFIGYTADLPLSFVGDTLTLPITVLATIERNLMDFNDPHMKAKSVLNSLNDSTARNDQTVESY